MEEFSAVDLYTSQQGLNHVGTGRVEVFSAVDLYTSQQGLNHVGTGRGWRCFLQGPLHFPAGLLTMCGGGVACCENGAVVWRVVRMERWCGVL